MVPWALCGFLGAFYFAFIGVVARAAFLRGAMWAIPLVWAGVEIGRSFVPGLAFPWFLLSTPLGAYPALDQLAFFGTQYFVSAWICQVNVVVVCLLSQRRIHPAYAIAAAIVPLLSFAWYLRPLETKPFVIAVGQPGFDMAFGDRQSQEVELARRIDLLESVARQARAALLVLPEGVMGATEFPPIPPFPLRHDLPILFGGQRGTEPAHQTAFLYDGQNWSFADKTRLVVFGEYVPGRDYLPFLKSFKLPGGDLTPGQEVTPLHLPGLTVGPMLCFEGLFYDVSHEQSQKGAQLLAGMSIDDWYMGTNAPEQLAAAASWRAMETGLPVVRAASSGYSLAVDQKGRELGELPLRASEDLIVNVPIQADPLKNPFRPLFPWLTGLFTVGFFSFCLWGHFAKKTKQAK